MRKGWGRGIWLWWWQDRKETRALRKTVLAIFQLLRVYSHVGEKRFLTQGSQVTNEAARTELEKPSFCSHHSSNCYREDLSWRQEPFSERWLGTGYLDSNLTDDSLVTLQRGKKILYSGENRLHFNHIIEVDIPSEGYTLYLLCLPLRCTEEERASVTRAKCTTQI